MNHSFRFAKREDTALILQFNKDLAQNENMLDQVAADENTLEHWIFDEKKLEVVFVLDEEGKEAGFALFFYTFSTFLGKPGLYIEDLYVKPEYRGRGYGKGLIKKLAAIAVDRGCARLDWMVLNWNQPSIAFYQSLGAKPVDDWTVYRVSGPTLNDLATSEK